MDLFASRPPGHAGDAAGPGRPPPPARAPHADDWDDDLAPRPGRRALLLAGAVVPWLVVGVVLVGRAGDAPAPTPTSAAAPGQTAPASAAAPTTPSTGSPDDVPTGGARGGDAGPTPAPESPAADDVVPAGVDAVSAPDARGEAAGVGVAAARAWLSSLPAPMAVDGLTPGDGADATYVEHLVVEAIDHPARGAAVVTVAALVLSVEGDAYGPPRRVRVAVPVWLAGDGARLAGAPWPLDTRPTAVAEAPAAVPVEDPDLRTAAVDALLAAGWQDVSLDALTRTGGWPLVATLTGVAPGQQDPHEHRVWLRADVGRLVVAGAPAPPTAIAPPAGRPEGEPTGPPGTEPAATHPTPPDPTDPVPTEATP